MKKIARELRDFIFRGNVIDMAVGVIIGAAFGAIVTSLVNDIFMPLISLITGTMDFSGLSVSLLGGEGAVLNYGAFITKVVDFLLIAVCIFFFIKAINRLTAKLSPKAEAAPEKEPRLCPYCFGQVNEKAVRCPHCTSEIPLEVSAQPA